MPIGLCQMTIRLWYIKKLLAVESLCLSLALFYLSGLDISLGSDGASLVVDLSKLNGTAPTAVRYAWSIVNCCDTTDPEL